MIDARGLACPVPVLMTQKEIKSNPAEIEVLVDNHAARENVTRLAQSSGYKVEVAQVDGDYKLTLTK